MPPLRPIVPKPTSISNRSSFSNTTSSAAGSQAANRNSGSQQVSSSSSKKAARFDDQDDMENDFANDRRVPPMAPTNKMNRVLSTSNKGELLLDASKTTKLKSRVGAFSAKHMSNLSAIPEEEEEDDIKYDEGEHRPSVSRQQYPQPQAQHSQAQTQGFPGAARQQQQQPPRSVVPHSRQPPAINVVNFSPTGRVVPRNIHRLLASLDSTLKLMLMMPTALERTIVAFEVFGLLGAEASNGNNDTKREFSLVEGQHTLPCCFYQMDYLLPTPLGARGSPYRVIGKFVADRDGADVFQCFAARSATDEEMQAWRARVLSAQAFS